MMKASHTLLAAVTLVSVVGTTQAALYDRGNGMIYDSSLNITWLQDANYAKTSGYAYGGLMSWEQANTWAANLNYAGLTGWRLASAGLIGTNNSYSEDGSTDYGFNNTRSEIGHLFFELGNKAIYDTAGVVQPDYGVAHTTFIDAGTNQSVSFLNLQNYRYWEAESYAPARSWSFSVAYGLQEAIDRTDSYRAWAVRAGDVAPAPVPAAGWLFGAALLGLTGMARKRKAV